jgi:O-antigen ligase
MSSAFNEIEMHNNLGLAAGETESDERQAKFAKPSVFVFGVAILTLFFVTQLMQLSPKLDGLPLVKIIVGLVAIIFITTPHLIANRRRLGEIPQFKYLLFILIFAACTLPLSFWREGSLQFLTQTFFKNVVFAYLVAQAAKDNRSTRLIAGALVAGCAVIVIAILTGFGPEISVFEAENRMMIGGTYDVNDLALLFVVTLPFAFFLIKDALPVHRLLLIGAIALMLIGIVKTASRGGFLGLVAISLFLLIRASGKARVYLLIAILLGAPLIIATAPEAFINRINTIGALGQDYNMSDRSGRKQVWENGVKMLVAHPLTGVGIGAFPIAHGYFSNSRIHIAPHNSFMQISAELGLPGIGLFLAIIISGFWYARKARHLARDVAGAEDLRWIGAAVQVSLIGFMVSGALLSHAYSPIFCFLAGISASLAARCKAFERTEQAEAIEYAWGANAIE